jgi:hypothetical protein
MLEYLFIVIIIVSLVIIGYSLIKMYNDIDLFKKIVIYDQMKKKELINNNAEEIKTNMEEIKSSKNALNTKINNDIESAVQDFNIHTDALNDLTNYIYEKNICDDINNKVRKSNGTKLSESELDSLNDKDKNTNKICCNNPGVSEELKNANFSCYPKESFNNYKNIEKFSEDEREFENTGLIEPELEDAEEIINTGYMPIPETIETTLYNSNLLESDFKDKVSQDAIPYDGLSIPGDLKISKKNGANVLIKGKNTRLCGTGGGSICSYFPYDNNNTYIRPGKKKGNIYVTHAKYFKAENNSNGLCGKGNGRLCSYFPYDNNHTYIRPGQNDKNIYIINAKHFRANNNSNILCGGSGKMCSHLPATNNHTYIRPGENSNNIYIGGTKENSDRTYQVVINSIKPLRAMRGIKIDDGKELCIGNECLTKDDIIKLRKLLNN